MPWDDLDPGKEDQRAALDDLYGEMRGVRQRNAKPKRKKKPVSKHQRKGAKGRSPVHDYVRSLGGDYKTTKEVCDELGVSEGYLRKLKKEERVKAPSMEAPFGSTMIGLYTTEDMEELRNYIADQRTPRPRHKENT